MTNVTKGNKIWAHFALTRCFPLQIQMSRPIQKEDVQIETFCCIFKHIRINWLIVQADQIGRTYPPLFTLNLLKEEEIIDDLREITAMEYVVQVIMIIVCIAIVIIVMYFCCTKCRHTHTIFKYCFLFLPISRIIHTSQHTDLLVEVTNVSKGNRIKC